MRSVQSLGRGYSGSGNKQSSVAGAEVLTELQDDNGYYDFSLQVYEDCHISFNGLPFIFLPANTTFETDVKDAPVTSLKFEEDNVQFAWVGAY